MMLHLIAMFMKLAMTKITTMNWTAVVSRPSILTGSINPEASAIHHL
jgi:hypothetical protein